MLYLRFVTEWSLARPESPVKSSGVSSMNTYPTYLPTQYEVAHFCLIGTVATCGSDLEVNLCFFYMDMRFGCMTEAAQWTTFLFVAHAL